LTATLSIAEWQIIEIARALSQEVRVLIMDEPTSALDKEEAERLVGIVRGLASEGVAVIYVSHRLDEIPRVADVVTVLREGRVVKHLTKEETSPRAVIEAMIGRDWTEAAAEGAVTATEVADQREVALQARDLRVPGRVFGIDLDVYKGEVLGLAGLVGAGATEALRAIYGSVECEGEVIVGGRAIGRRNPRTMTAAGVALLTDDRKREGLFPDLSVADNVALGNLGKVSRRGWLSPRLRSEAANSAIDTLAIKTSSIEQNVQSLSGGNQQKVVIARCLAAGANVLLMDEPTRGVDVEAKFQIYQFLRGLAERGLSVIVAPSEFDELTQMCDRIVVMREGRVVSQFTAADADIQQVMAAAMGDAPSRTNGQSPTGAEEVLPG
jgi:ABC-type sugar transport system ATPase subunit